MRAPIGSEDSFSPRVEADGGALFSVFFGAMGGEKRGRVNGSLSSTSNQLEYSIVAAD
jgi:hypothetical protein